MSDKLWIDKEGIGKPFAPNPNNMMRKGVRPLTIADLRAALAAAFAEGFACGASRGNIAWKHPPVAVAWQLSDARATLDIPIDGNLVNQWKQLEKMVDCEAFDPQMEQF